MLLITKISYSELLDYKKNIIDCLNFNHSNDYIKQIIVFLDAVDNTLPKLPKVRYLVKKDYDANLLNYAKKLSKYETIIWSDNDVKFREADLKKISISPGYRIEKGKYKIVQKNDKVELANKSQSKTIFVDSKFTDIRKSERTLIEKNLNKKLNVLIVSVNYNDFLILTLQKNSKLFENITVVTSPDDFLCQKICEKFNVNCLITDVMFESGAKFNKGKAINFALNSIDKESFVLILDADIIVENPINIEELENNTLYTSGRWIVKDHDSYKEYEVYGTRNLTYESNKGLGFFQLFYNERQRYPEDFNDAGWSDLVFRDKFTVVQELTNRILHLGKIKKNWSGRKTPEFIKIDIINEIISENNLYNESGNVLRISKRNNTQTPKLAILTTYFNPKNYINLKNNYLEFYKGIKNKSDLFTIELSFDGNFFIENENTIRIKGNSDNILWQKERLLNILLDKIPKEYTNIAWVDCDIIFENENWIVDCNEKLKNYEVVQLYEYANRLNEFGDVELVSKGIIKRISEINLIDLNLSKGIPGFAWAIRRETIDKIKFLDTQVIGGGDSLMCYSFLGEKNGFVSNQMNSEWFDHYHRWFKLTNRIVNKSVNFVPGNITHLYHGKMQNRKYNDRYKILTEYNFNPSIDLVKDDNELWKFKNKDISDRLKIYFDSRNEDDNIIDINSYFDRIFLLNLDRKPEKFFKMSEKLKSLNIKFERFSAIDGLYLNYDLPEFVQGKGMIENNFALGCLLSHLEIIKTSKNRGYKKILIFEDDIMMSKNIKLSIQKIKKIEDWKLLYFGASQYDWKVESHKDDFYLSRKSLGTFAYAIDCSIFDDVINLLENKYKSVDNILADIQEKYYGNCFTFYPNICIADVSESDIREKRDNFEHSKKMRWNLIDYV